MLVKSGYEYTLSIPQHDELGRGLLRKLIRQAAPIQLAVVFPGGMSLERRRSRSAP